MASNRGSGRRGTRGFASMDNERKRRVASQGGNASARGNRTSNRGFASMDKEKQRLISSMGGRASKSSQSPAKDEADAERKDIESAGDATGIDLVSTENEDNLESFGETQGSLASSETDEDEDEGLGDGNLGRSTRGKVIDE